MIRLQLSDHEVQMLEQQFRTTTNRKLRDRLQIVLLAARGRPHKGIAHDVGIAPRTVQRWLHAYRAGGLDGLHPRKAPGAAPKLRPDLAGELRRWVIAGPQAQGLDRANWTYAELAIHLYQTHGITIRKSAMQVFCRWHGIRPYRPTYRFLRGDPTKQAVARTERATWKKSPRGRTRLAKPG
jgi:transposase